MRLIISGCRWVKGNNPTLIPSAIDLMGLDEPISSIVHGGASGIDALAIDYARDNRIKAEPCNANWTKYGRAAGPIRNAQMAQYGDRLLAIWDYKSKGTQSMILEMAKANKPMYVYKISKDEFISDEEAKKLMNFAGEMIKES